MMMRRENSRKRGVAASVMAATQPAVGENARRPRKNAVPMMHDGADGNRAGAADQSDTSEQSGTIRAPPSRTAAAC